MEIKLPVEIVKGTLSGAKRNSNYNKAKIQKVVNGETSYYQFSLFTDKQVFHKNLNEEELEIFINEMLDVNFNNMEIFTSEYVYGYRITSKGKLLTNKRRNNESFLEVNHNKKKNYLLNEGMIIPPLIDLGVMTSDGKVVKARYDKYKQINRFLEIIDDNIKDEKKLKIIDFGCGKSYLTFILYYYLVEVKKMECEIIGLDLKNEVIDECNRIAEKYHYDNNLKFLKGDISTFEQSSNIDMIITLHACDTATDYALYHAIRMKCKYIFSVPCCQHEINSQMDSSYLHLINKFGILKERFSAIITDSIRANILQYCGYKTQVMEFVDLENSPKNLLIRAVYVNNAPNNKIKKEIDALIEETKINQTLYNLIFNNKDLSDN
ncbi:MAG: SAM-dependent methyltransferase [Erysipelotrichaceae bacterium]|nr:SAM-dependent methyltransferase [Erysipelotrichaceae bacterium]